MIWNTNITTQLCVIATNTRKYIDILLIYIIESITSSMQKTLKAMRRCLNALQILANEHMQYNIYSHMNTCNRIFTVTRLLHRQEGNVVILQPSTR